MASPSRNAPLAERLRPQSIAEVVGQRHLLGEGKAVGKRHSGRRAALDDFLGAAGRRKTTLARLLADAFDAEMIALSAVMAGIRTSARPSSGRR